MSVAGKKKVCFIVRGGLVPLFFLLSFGLSYSDDNHPVTVNRIVQAAMQKNLHQSPVWRSLLQVTGNRLNIKDPKFILTGESFSLEGELARTIEGFFAQPGTPSEHAVCRFPARLLWLKSELGLPDGIFPDVRCDEFEEYRERAPAQHISLVFVSEDVAQPSSMMGHVFFRLSGYDRDLNYREHAVSFYTIIDTANIPMLILKSTVTGMKGFFSLQPYNEQVQRYLRVEDRSIWEYELALSDKNRLLMYYHMWELKPVKMRYLFTGYNCATVIHNILSLSSEDFSRDGKWLWVTPKSVVKEAHENHLIAHTKLIPSVKWNIRMLSDALDKDSSSYVYNMFEKQVDHLRLSEDNARRLYQIELINSYSAYARREGKADKDKLNAIAGALAKATENDQKNTYYIDISQYKSPIRTFGESQLGIGYKMFDHHNYMKFHFLPAANTFSDNNKEYFNENVLKLCELSLLLNENTVRLESFQLYNMKSLIPYNAFVKGISGEFRFGLEQHYDKELRRHLSGNTSGGVGLTRKLSEDVNVYVLINGGPAYADSRFYVYFYPEVGAAIYEIMNMKTTVSYKYFYNQLGSGDFYHDVALTQSLFLQKKFKVSGSVERRFNERHSNNEYELMFTFYF